MTDGFARALLIAASLLFAPLVHAQAPYPAKPVRLMIPYPPAGTTDFVGRIVGQKIGEGLGTFSVRISQDW